MQPNQLPNDQQDYDVFKDQNSLENLEVVEAKPLEDIIEESVEPTKQKRNFKPKARIIIILLIGIIIFAAGLIIAGSLSKNDEKSPDTNVVINTQSLDNGTLNEVTPDDSGTVRQQLTISPNTIFKNDVSVQGSTNITENLSVDGSANIQGATSIKDSLSVGKNLSVNGLITAATLSVGSLTISSINLSSNLVFGGHIVPFGSEPVVRPSTAAGGGNVTVSGNDTAGTITITTNGALSSGELAIITFRAPFSATPKVQLTPLNAPASGLNYYATHTANFFTINTSSATTVGTTYIFDYLVTQ